MQPATDSGERLARLRLIRSENVGPVNFRRLITRFGSAAEALDALPDIAARAGRRNLRIATIDEAQRESDQTEKLGARHLMMGDADYPPLLLEADGAPPVLAVVGETSLLQRSAVAIVGARNCSSNGRTLCRRIAEGLGEAGVTVVSGLARGIDTEAHKASISTGTVAVIAGGIDNIYPSENSELQHQIAEQGLLIAESPLGTQPRARHFPRRNRIIAGSSLGVVVIEAALRSGSLITARQAGEQGREVFAVPGSPLDPRAAGANKLIRDGAYLIENANDVLDQIGPQGLFENRRTASDAMTPPDIQKDIAPSDSESGREAILEALSPEPCEADTVIRITGMAPGLFHALVLELEIGGSVERHAGNRYALRAVE